jgi:hypothetical protein
MRKEQVSPNFIKLVLKEYTESYIFLLPEGWKLQYQHLTPQQIADKFSSLFTYEHLSAFDRSYQLYQHQPVKVG